MNSSSISPKEWGLATEKDPFACTSSASDENALPIMVASKRPIARPVYPLRFETQANKRSGTRLARLHCKWEKRCKRSKKELSELIDPLIKKEEDIFPNSKKKMPSSTDVVEDLIRTIGTKKAREENSLLLCQPSRLEGISLKGGEVTDEIPFWVTTLRSPTYAQFSSG